MPPMKTPPTPVDWPARAVIYQVNLRSLAAREPRTGNTQEEIETFRDEGLLMLLQYHRTTDVRHAAEEDR